MLHFGYLLFFDLLAEVSVAYFAVRIRNKRENENKYTMNKSSRKGATPRWTLDRLPHPGGLSRRLPRLGGLSEEELPRPGGLWTNCHAPVVSRNAGRHTRCTHHKDRKTTTPIPRSEQRHRCHDRNDRRKGRCTRNTHHKVDWERERGRRTDGQRRRCHDRNDTDATIGTTDIADSTATTQQRHTSQCN